MGFSAYAGGRIFSFSMTAGYNTPGVANRGYCNLSVYPNQSTSYGSISNEPFGLSHRIGWVVAGTNNAPGLPQIFIAGDVVALVTGLNLYIDGSQFTIQSLQAASDPLFTRAIFSPAFQYAIGQTYTIQLRR